MFDIFVMYPVAWMLFMGAGIAGYVISRGAVSVYLSLQVLSATLVLYFFRDTFCAMEANAWMMYLSGFIAYLVAFLFGARTESVGWVVIFQAVAFMMTFLTFPWLFGFTGGG